MDGCRGSVERRRGCGWWPAVEDGMRAAGKGGEGGVEVGCYWWENEVGKLALVGEGWR